MAATEMEVIIPVWARAIMALGVRYVWKYNNLCMWEIGSFNNDGGDGNENGKKTIGLISKTTTLHVHHTFLYISLPSIA